MKKVIFGILVLLALGGCSRRSTLTYSGNNNSIVDEDPVTPVSECPNGLSASALLVDSRPSSLVVGQSISFQVIASGCSHAYLLYTNGQSAPMRFEGATTFSRTYFSPQTSIQESATVVALNATGQPVVQRTVVTPAFSVTAAPVQTTLSCSVDPAALTFNIPVNATGEPVLTAPPAWTVTVNSTLPAKLKSLTTPVSDYFAISSMTPIPSTLYRSANAVSGTLLKLSAGSVEFTVETDTGTARCSGNSLVNLVPVGTTPLPQYLFRGDVSGDGKEDIVSWDASSGVFWVARSSSGGTFDYVNFGSLGAVQLQNAFLGNFNGDNKADILVRIQSTGMWKLGFSSGAVFTFADLGTWPATPVLTDIDVQDLTGDGRPEVIGNYGGVSYSSSITINGNSGSIAAPVVRDPVVTLQASPTTVTFAGASTLSWTSSNSTSCRLKANGSLVTLPSGPNLTGSYSASNLRMDTDFVAECVKSGTSTYYPSPVRRVTVGTPPTPVIDFFVKTSASDSAPTPTIVQPNAMVQIRWATQNITSCDLLQGSEVIGSGTSSAYIASKPIASNTDFKLRCVSVAGTAVDSQTISVNVAATLSYNPNTTLDYGNVYFGKTSAPQKLKITNAAGRVAASVIVTIPDGFVFGGGTCVASNIPFVLNSGASCDFLISFQPVKMGNSNNRTYNVDLNVSYGSGVGNVINAAVKLIGTGSVEPTGGK